MDENYTYLPIPLSELPIIQDAETGDFWVFASTENTNGLFDSGRFNLKAYLDTAKEALQLERRITLTLEAPSQDMLIGEEMTIYKVLSGNVASLNMTIGDTVTPIPLNTAVNVRIPAGAIVDFSVVKQLTDPKAYLYILAKVITL